MSDLDSKKRSDFKNKVKESVEAVEYDNQCKQKDFNDFVKKFQYLKNFRDDNKNVSIWNFTYHFFNLDLDLDSYSADVHMDKIYKVFIFI